ncbi:MAG: pseudoazurin [Pseudomonadota bacterium]
MLNADCNDANVINVFEPPILHVAPGDEVTFLSTDAGHNTASKRGMLPEGADAWNSTVDEDVTLRFDVPGVYGYVCVPHYEMGMVGLIVVGEDYSNLDQLKRVRQVGDARRAFRALIEQLETA